MRLAQFVSRFPSIRVATEADNERILAFFDDTPMETTAFAVQYRRGPDFFRLLRYQADRWHVFVAANPTGPVCGVATISLRPGWVHRSPTVVGYLGDLRVGHDRRVAAEWRTCWRALFATVHEIDELADVTHWFTTILDDNVLARRVLSSPGNVLPACLPMAPFTMRNLVARIPGHRPRESRWRVRHAEAADQAALSQFFERENSEMPLGFRGELTRRLACWDHLTLGDFIVASDGDGLAACVAPWSPSDAKQTLISRIPLGMRVLRRAVAAIPGHPVRIPDAGEPLRTAYLTHLTFASRLSSERRAQVFRAMLDHVFDGWRDHPWHCAAVADFDAWNLGRALDGYVQQCVRITVYGVVPPRQTTTDFESLRSAAPPAFEMATV